jgi:hypothetical protein
MDLDPGPPADEFVIGTLVDVLKATPAADVIDENTIEVPATLFDVADQSSVKNAQAVDLDS